MVKPEHNASKGGLPPAEEKDVWAMGFAVSSPTPLGPLNDSPGCVERVDVAICFEEYGRQEQHTRNHSPSPGASQAIFSSRRFDVAIASNLWTSAFLAAQAAQ